MSVKSQFVNEFDKMKSTSDTDKESAPLEKLLYDYIHGTSVTSENNSLPSEKESPDALKKEIIVSLNSLVKHENSFIKIVEYLSSVLTDKNVEVRAKGMALLAEFIHQYPPGSMNNKEMDTLMTFFCDRLKDHHSIQPLVIYAFLGLVSYQNLTDDLIIDMLHVLFSEVHVQSLVQADRRNVFNIFSNLLKTKIHVLKSFSGDFVLGFIQAMDSERDPRNLVICFENSFLVIQELDFSLFVEDLFEVLSCYFPVEFREPKDNEFRIKKEDLVCSLRKCLTSTHLFGPYAIPLYLEKLSSELMESKLDSLITFTDCLKVYKPHDISLFIDDIWLQIRKDFLLSDIAELSFSYKQFIYQLVLCLAKLDDEASLMKMVGFLIKDCLQTLKDPEMTIAVSCSDVILCSSNASQKVFEKTVFSLIPPIQTAFEKYTSSLQRTCLLEIISKILSVDNDMEIAPVHLVDFVNHILPLLYSMISDSDDVKLKVLCLKCMESTVSKSKWFRSCDFDILAQHVFYQVHHTALNSQLLEAYESFVRTIAQVFPHILKKQFLDVFEINIAAAENKLSSQCLHLLGFSCDNNELCKDIYLYFSRFIAITAKENLECCKDVLDCYTAILRKSEDYVDGKLFVVPLLNLLASVLEPSESLLLKVSYALSESFNHIDSAGRRALYTFVYEMLTGNLSITSNLFGCPYALKMDSCLLQFTFLVRSVFTQLQCKEIVELDVSHLCAELFQLMNANIHDSTILEHLGLSYASVVNKLEKDSPIVEQNLHLISDCITEKKVTSVHVVLLSWITKALVLNWQDLTCRAIDLLLACLNDEEIGYLAAKGLHIVVKNVEGALNKESKAVIKLMYKQRFSQYTLPLLISNYHDGGSNVKSFHMTAISNALPAIPKQTLKTHLKLLLPLLMHSLAISGETSTIESTLSTISLVLDENKDSVVEYVPSLVPRLLHLATHEQMNIRIVSLKSLAILSSYTAHVVLPLRNEVIRKLRFILDDKKRLVRKEAMKCSNAWHLMLSNK